MQRLLYDVTLFQLIFVTGYKYYLYAIVLRINFGTLLCTYRTSTYIIVHVRHMAWASRPLGSIVYVLRVLGKLKPRVKSQPKPKKQGSVVTVVGSTFEDIVHDKKKDVLIEFYAPWCGHCKKLEPVYKVSLLSYRY